MAFNKPQDLLDSDLPPEVAAPKLMEFIMGVQTTQVLGVLARLGVPDLVAMEGYTPVADIACQVGANEALLYRTMRAAANIGVFKEAPEGGAFAMTTAASLLRSDAPASLKWMAGTMSMKGHHGAFGELYNVLQTGKSGMELTVGTNLFDALRTTLTDEMQYFDHTMNSMTLVSNPPAVGAYNWGQHKNVVDVGGGFGALLEALLRANPRCKGQVFDRAQVVDEAPPVAADLAGRLTFVKGNFFESIPVKSDCFTMKHILHDWDDAQCITIMRNIKASLEPNGVVVVLDSVMPPPGEDRGDGNCWKDIQMLVATTGKERSAKQWQAVMTAAGYSIEGIQPLQHSDLSAIICKPSNA